MIEAKRTYQTSTCWGTRCPPREAEMMKSRQHYTLRARGRELALSCPPKNPCSEFVHRERERDVRHIIMQSSLSVSLCVSVWSGSVLCESKRYAKTSNFQFRNSATRFSVFLLLVAGETRRPTNLISLTHFYFLFPTNEHNGNRTKREEAGAAIQKEGL